MMSLLLLGLISMPVAIHAQNKVTLDFNNLNSVTLPTKINQGNLYNVVIKNINLNLHKVTINSKDSIISKALSTPTFGSLSLDALSSAVSNIESINTSFTKVIELTQKEKEFYAALPTIKDNAHSDVIEVQEYLQGEKLTMEKYLPELYSIDKQMDSLKLHKNSITLY
jgi:membrane-anchored protein YejM (alkaline phosphatase superfamily)